MLKKGFLKAVAGTIQPRLGSVRLLPSGTCATLSPLVHLPGIAVSDANPLITIHAGHRPGELIIQSIEATTNAPTIISPTTDICSFGVEGTEEGHSLVRYRSAPFPAKRVIEPILWFPERAAADRALAALNQALLALDTSEADLVATPPSLEPPCVAPLVRPRRLNPSRTLGYGLGLTVILVAAVSGGLYWSHRNVTATPPAVPAMPYPYGPLPQPPSAAMAPPLPSSAPTTPRAPVPAPQASPQVDGMSKDPSLSARPILDGASSMGDLFVRRAGGSNKNVFGVGNTYAATTVVATPPAPPPSSDPTPAPVGSEASSVQPPQGAPSPAAVQAPASPATPNSAQPPASAGDVFMQAANGH